MKSRNPRISWLDNPEVFEVNRNNAHSDHVYPFFQEAGSEGIGFMLLDGVWDFCWEEQPPEYALRGTEDSDGVVFYKAALRKRTGERSRFPAMSSFRGMTTAIMSIPCIHGMEGQRSVLRPLTGRMLRPGAM